MKTSPSSTSATTADAALASPADSHYIRGLVLMGACLAFFTANALLIKYLGSNQQVGTWPLVLLRGIVGLAFVVVWYGQRSGLRVMRVFTRPALVARGLLGSLGLICYYWTIPRLGTGVATLVSSTYVVLGAALGTCFFLR
ncbi:MAG: hypothetical protein ACKVHP_06020, partial [Verrucomicrobiales bacterium]